MEASGIVGYRFHPSDEVAVNHHLKRKLLQEKEKKCLIPELNIYDYEPWHLLEIYDEKSEAKSDGRQCFFFCPRNSTSPKGRTKRKAGGGFWKDTSRKRTIKVGKTVGTKRILVFHCGKQKNAHPTEWVMHEYHLISLNGGAGHDVPDLAAFSLCRIKRKPKKKAKSPTDRGNLSSPSTATASSTVEFDATNELQIDTAINVDVNESQLLSQNFPALEENETFDVDELLRILEPEETSLSLPDCGTSPFDLQQRKHSLAEEEILSNNPCTPIGIQEDDFVALFFSDQYDQAMSV